MKKNYFLFMIAFLVGTLLLGCGSKEKATVNLADNNSKATEFELIANAKNLPLNFDDIAFKRKETPLFSYLVKKVENQSEYEDVWELYGFENEKPSADFGNEDVVFVGLQESGSCPYEIKDIESNSESKTLLISLLSPDGNCTADASPRTFVIKMDKKTSEKLENVSIIASGLETTIPFD